jgi:hypothetical protein
VQVFTRWPHCKSQGMALKSVSTSSRCTEKKHAVRRPAKRHLAVYGLWYASVHRILAPRCLRIYWSLSTLYMRTAANGATGTFAKDAIVTHGAGNTYLKQITFRWSCRGNSAGQSKTNFDQNQVTLARKHSHRMSVDVSGSSFFNVWKYPECFLGPTPGRCPHPSGPVACNLFLSSVEAQSNGSRSRMPERRFIYCEPCSKLIGFGAASASGFYAFKLGHPNLTSAGCRQPKHSAGKSGVQGPGSDTGDTVTCPLGFCFSGVRCTRRASSRPMTRYSADVETARPVQIPTNSALGCRHYRCFHELVQSWCLQVCWPQ